MPRPTRPQDLFVTNGWYLELAGLISPHFETLEGIQRHSNKVSIVDAGSNKKYQFGTQIMDFGEMTLTRTYQGTVDDITLEVLVHQMITEGVKFFCNAIKMHNKREVFRIQFEGFNIHSSTYPTFDVNAEDKFLVSYIATCDDWNIIR